VKAGRILAHPLSPVVLLLAKNKKRGASTVAPRLDSGIRFDSTPAKKSLLKSGMQGR